MLELLIRPTLWPVAVSRDKVHNHVLLRITSIHKVNVKAIKLYSMVPFHLDQSASDKRSSGQKSGEPVMFLS